MPPPNRPSIWQANELPLPPGTDVATAPASTDNELSETRKGWEYLLSPKVPDLDLSARELREEIGLIASAAAEGFANACEASASDPERAENTFSSVTVRIKELWAYSKIRDLPFRDLLAAIDAAIRHHVLGDFNNEQRDAIGLALRLLCRWHIGSDDVDETIKRFVSHKIDLLGPVTSGKRQWKVTVTEITEDDNSP